MTDPLQTVQRRPGRRKGCLTFLLVIFLIASYWWAPPLLSRLAFFRLRQVEVKGTHFVAPHDIVARMRIDTLTSIWGNTERYRERIESHPQVRSADIERKLPSTLVVTVHERPPIALVPAAQGFQIFDSAAHLLPLDPRVSAPDLPIVAQRDTALIGLLGRIRSQQPALFDRISEVARSGPAEIAVTLTWNDEKSGATPSDSSVLSPNDSTAKKTPPPIRTIRVRLPLGVTVTRLTDIFPVESDLRRRGAKIVELDLRYRDQVIARVQ